MGIADVSRACNELTVRWAERLPAQGTVFSALGVWPLLARLADVADGAAREELERAVGMPAAAAAEAAGELHELLSSSDDGIGAALGLWSKAGLPLRQEWLKSLPPGAHEEFTGDLAADKSRLDAWAREHTHGLIEAMPTEIDAETMLLLASALVIETTWTTHFEDWEGPWSPEHGPWQGRPLAVVTEAERDPAEIAVAETDAGPLTALRLGGTGAVDVHLLLGEPELGPAEVLPAGIDLLEGRAVGASAEQLPMGTAGPGVVVSTVQGQRPTPQLNVLVPRFTVADKHDLLDHADLFGLEAAADATSGHFPGIGPAPLAVNSAQQAAKAQFDAKGFRAGVVTALVMWMSGLPAMEHQRKLIMARFDRPFGFLAVHRSTGLVLVAGWVTDPELADTEAEQGE